MERYSFNTAKYGTHNIIAKQIGINKLVLDVGCNKGYLRKLSDSSNSFFGIDYDGDDLLVAKNKECYVEVFRQDLNAYAAFICDKKFDVIVFGDILEHLLHPEKVLMFFVDNYLKENGKVIISLPNVANFMIRLKLLFGEFNYVENGILDKTHLHLYTTKSARSLIRRCKLRIIGKYYSSNSLGWIIVRLPFLGNVLGFNIILVCQKEY